ncbi:MAG: TIGR00266 family protein [Clostridiales bacterium]|nr:TIGR00266 family protein [Clostridiales bacterium]
MEYVVQGGNLPVLIMTLQPGEQIVTEAGGMSWMTPNVKMDTNMKGGLGKAIGRKLTGESMFLNTFTCEGGPGQLACASSFPGSIMAFELAAGESIIAQKSAFLCSTPGVNMEVHFRQKISVGIFGGEGFLLQRMTGPGRVFLEIDGSYVKYSLNEGQQLVIDPGHMAVQDASVQTELTRVKGMKNIFLGGEGLFLATLTGPGDVYLQTMTAQNFAGRIIPYMPQPKS